MRRNKYISYFLVILFFVSATGIPVAVHICRAMNEITFESCGMCDSKEEKNYPVFERTDCCNSKIVASHNSSFYLLTQLNKEEVKISDVITLQLDIDFAFNHDEAKNSEICNNSPPKTDTPLFITNLSLLI